MIEEDINGRNRHNFYVFAAVVVVAVCHGIVVYCALDIIVDIIMCIIIIMLAEFAAGGNAIRNRSKDFAPLLL